MENLSLKDKEAIDYYKKYIKEQSLNDNPSSFISVHDQNRFNIVMHELNAHLFSGGSFDTFFESKSSNKANGFDDSKVIDVIKEYVTEELNKLKDNNLSESFKFEDFQDWQLELLKGDSLKFEDLTLEQKEELKGEKGESFNFESLTEEEKLQLKGDKGDSVNIRYRGEHSRPPSKPNPGDIYRDVSVNPNTVFMYNGDNNKWEMLVADGAYGGTPGGGGLGEYDVQRLIDQAVTSTGFDDSEFNIYDNNDDTKKITFQASNISSGETREITMSDYDIDISKPHFTSATIGDKTSDRYLKIGINGELQLDTTLLPDYIKGQLSYDPGSLTVVADTGIDGVRLQLGQEEYWLVYNNSGEQINNGKACFASGVDPTNKVITIALADRSLFVTSAQVLGLATHNIPNGELGLVTKRGVVRDFDTSSIHGGLVWLSTSGDLTNDRPLYPDQRVNMGVLLDSHPTSGSFVTTPERITRNDVSKSYSFTSQGIPAGTFWKAGFYDFSTNSNTFSQATPSITYGIVNRARDAHVSICAAGPGTVNTGQVGLRVVGIIDSEDGIPQQADQIGIITDDITTLSANTYYETEEKFSGQVTFELYVVSGTPTVYSLDANYGFAKYDDLQDRDYTITGFECVWQGNTTSTLDIALIKHTNTGWTYAPTGFIPGNGDICRKSIDMPLASDVENGIDGAYKRTNLNVYVAGETGEGHIIQVITGANNTIQTMDMHVEGVSEELDF